jgi:hypothetical protein
MLLNPQTHSGAFQASLMDGAEMGRGGHSLHSPDEGFLRAPFKRPLAKDGLMKIRVKITTNDIEDWRKTPCLHPLVEVLRCTTHTNWRMIDSIMVAEREPPFRTVYLGSDLMLQLLDCKNGSGPASLECEIELILPFCD